MSPASPEQNSVPADVFVLGSTNVDLVVRTDRLPGPGETVLGGTFLQAHGGKGANQAVAAARAGAAVRFATCIGTDAFGERALAALQEEGIDTRLVRRSDDHPTGIALITVDQAGENCIVVAPGANGALKPADITTVDLEGCSIFVAQLEVPLETISHGLSLARDLGLVTLLDPAPAQPLASDVLSLIYCLTPNVSELATLTGIRAGSVTDCERAAYPLLDAGIETVIVTLGPDGAVLVDTHGAIHQPAPSVDAIDATAAGDAFAGALAAEVAIGATFREALPFAGVAGALATTIEGAQPAIPRREEISRFSE
jgi:ribokinase